MKNHIWFLCLCLALLSVASADCEAVTEGGYDWPLTPVGQNVTLPCIHGAGSAYRNCETTGWGQIDDDECETQKCPAGQDADHRQWPETNAGVTAQLDCPVGQSGSVSRLCNAMGEWENPVDGCTSLVCPSESSGGHVWPDTEAGQRAHLTCPTGQVGELTRMCSSTGQWEEVINTCEARVCLKDWSGYLPWPETNPGETAKIDCPAYIKGTASRSCSSTAVWESEPFACDGTRCSSETVSGVNWPLTALNTLRTMPCKDSVLMMGRFCRMGGDWSEVFNTCDLKCPAETDSGQSFEATAAGKTAQVPCGEDFTGYYSRECSSEVRWGTVTNNCVRMRCPMDKVSHVDGKVDVPATPLGQVASTDCPSGFDGSVTVMCNIAGTWEQPQGECIRARCGEISSQVASYPETEYDNTATGTCLPGFSGTASRECTETDLWKEPVEDCVQLSCPSDDDNRWPTTPAGSTIEVECNMWNEGAGVKKRMCGFEGTWGVVESLCLPDDFSYTNVVKSFIKGADVTVTLERTVSGYDRFGLLTRLPFGLTLDSSTGEISGKAFEVCDGMMTRVAGYHHGNNYKQSTVKFTIHNNECRVNEADEGGYGALIVGTSLEKKCRLFNTEKRTCNAIGDQAQLGDWDGACNTADLILYGVIGVVALIVVVLIVVLIMRSSGRRRYPAKKLKVKLPELAGV